MGCGPGPYTAILSGRGGLAIDFSRTSLEINKKSCATEADWVFLQEDLNNLVIPKFEFDISVMADFIQHLGSRTQREELLMKSFSALKPGGYFYLTFFNVNILNYLRGDIHGGWVSNSIIYERLTIENVISSLPGCAIVKSVRPMNIFNKSCWLDRAVSRFPMARYLGRMIEITGIKSLV